MSRYDANQRARAANKARQELHAAEDANREGRIFLLQLCGRDPWVVVNENEGETVKKYTLGRAGVAWCAYFVAWCYRQVGAPLRGDPYELGACRYMQEQMIAHREYFDVSRGAWKNARVQTGAKHQVGAFRPAPGDVVFFHGADRRYPAHVGLVSAYLPPRLWVVSGNHADQVAMNSYGDTAAEIIGFGRP